MTRLVFLDTETTSLRPDRRVWEVGLIVREDGAHATADVEKQWFVDRADLDLGNADPMSLTVGGFWTRHPSSTTETYAEAHVLRAVGRLTAGALVVGAVPWFDTEVLAVRMRANAMCPAWHYHLIDVEALAAGALKLAPPWNFDQVLAAYGLAYDEAERHTALGDARMVRDLYDAILGGQQ